MPRPKRKCVGGVVYHVLNRANGRLRIFKKSADFEGFERILAEGLERVDAKLQNCIKRRNPFGNDRWIQLAAQKLGLEMTLRPRGRPRKGS